MFNRCWTGMGDPRYAWSLPPQEARLPGFLHLLHLPPPQPGQARARDGVGSVCLVLRKARNFRGKLNRVQVDLTFFAKGGSRAHSVEDREHSPWSLRHLWLFHSTCMVAGSQVPCIAAYFITGPGSLTKLQKKDRA